MSFHAPESEIELPIDEVLLPDLPDGLEAQLAPRLSPGERLHYAIEVDMRPDGAFGTGYLLATDDHFYSCAWDGRQSSAWIEVPLETVEKVEVRDYHGVAAFEAVTSERAIRLARFTKARLDDVHKFRRATKALLPSGEGEKDWHGGGDRKKDVCEKCNQPIPHWFAGVCPNCVDKRKVLSRLLGRMKPYAGWISLGLLMMLLITAMDLVQPILTKILFDQVLPGTANPDGNLPLLWRILGLIVVLSATSTVLSGLRGYLMSWLGEKVTLDLRNELYSHIQTLSLSFYDSKQTGWIMDRVSNDTGNLQDFLTDAVQEFIRDFFQIILITIIMFQMSPHLAVATLLPLPFITFLGYKFMRKTHKMYHLMWRRRAKLTSLLSDVVPGVRVVKAFAQEDRERERYQETSRDMMDASLSVAKFSNMVWPTMGFLGGLGFAVVWGYGGYLAVTGTGDVTAGTIVAFMGYFWRFQGPLQHLSRMAQRVQRAATSAQRVFEVLDTQPSVAEPVEPKPMPPITGAVEFRDVVFGYEPHNPVLKGVSFTVAPGEMIGLVGPSGAGKSTSINLISRFYDVNDGAILIDGVDIRDVEIHSLRSQIGVVLQEPFLFHGTLSENISYGKPDASREEIIEAAKAANAHEFIMRMPEGYDTMVGERGARLSGGERQRISIARAILKDPRILILDEATSSVDTETEAQIREAIDRLVKNRTTFAIAHRFSTLRNADRLVVLEHGHVREVGTHEELMAKEDGLFRRLTEVQSELSRIVAVGG